MNNTTIKISELADGYKIDSPFLSFDPLSMESATCGDIMNPQLTNVFVRAEECTRFVYEHCVGKLRFFMVISGVFLFVILVLMNKHGYFEREKKFIINEFKWIKGRFKKNAR